MRRILLAIALLVAYPLDLWAGGPCSGVRGGCGRSSYRSSARSSSGGGSVAVGGYVRKDGTYVRPHTRSAPGSGSFVPIPSFSVRTTARTEPRRRAWSGTSSSYDEDEYATTMAPPPDNGKELIAPPPEPTAEQEPARETQAKYRVRFRSGGTLLVVSYEDLGDKYEFFLPRGTQKVPKSAVAGVEPLADDVASASLPAEGVVLRALSWNSIQLNGGPIIHLLGVSAGAQADGSAGRALNRQAIQFLDAHLKGRVVKLRYDSVNAGRRHRDDAKALLAHVTREDGWDAAVELIGASLASPEPP